MSSADEINAQIDQVREQTMVGISTRVFRQIKLTMYRPKEEPARQFLGVLRFDDSFLLI